MDRNDLLDHIVEVEAVVAQLRVLVEGTIILFDEVWAFYSPAQTHEQRQAEQCLDAVGLALDDLRRLILSLQEGSIRLSEQMEA